MQNPWPTLAPHRMKLAAAAVLLAIVAIIFLGRPPSHQENPLLESPVIALQTLQAKSLYFNGVARPWLVSQRPDLLTDADRSDSSDAAHAFSQAVLNPNLFRQLFRQYHFDALLFTGDPSQYRPLLDHLITTKDWKLSYADHTSLVFRRDLEKPWQISDLDPVRAKFANAPSHDRAIFLAQTGVKLVAARELDAAKLVLDEAQQLDDHLPDVWNGMANYHMAKSEWRDAFSEVDRALHIDGNFLPAVATKTQLLYGSKRYSEACDLSRELITKLPDDPNLLFYHAKIAHEAHAYKEEIDALLKLISRAQAENQPVSGYQIYLAQAYAKTGDAGRSMDQFFLALEDPDLSDEQRSYVEESIVRIKKKGD